MNPSIIKTKYASFDANIIRSFPTLAEHFIQGKQNESLQLLLQEQECDFYFSDQYDRKELLQCMITNQCVSMDFKYFWWSDLMTITHIKFQRLQRLAFSVDSDCGYMTQIQFLPLIDAPNLIDLDLSNVEDCGYSLRSFRKCYFPKLKKLNLEMLECNLRDFQTLSEANIPILDEILLELDDVIELRNSWKAKMESTSLRKQYQIELKEQLQLGSEESSQNQKNSDQSEGEGRGGEGSEKIRKQIKLD